MSHTEMVFQPKYNWLNYQYSTENNPYPVLIYRAQFTPITLPPNVKIGGSWNIFANTTHWFNVRTALCEQQIFLYPLQSKYFHVVDGILVQPYTNNLSVYTDFSNPNVLYICDIMRDRRICATIEFNKDSIILTESWGHD